MAKVAEVPKGGPEFGVVQSVDIDSGASCERGPRYLFERRKQTTTESTFMRKLRPFFLPRGVKTLSAWAVILLGSFGLSSAARASLMTYSSSFEVTSNGNFVDGQMTDIQIGDVYTFTFTLDSAALSSSQNGSNAIFLGSALTLNSITHSSGSGTYAPSWTSASTSFIVGNLSPGELYTGDGHFTGGSAAQYSSLGVPGTAALQEFSFTITTSGTYPGGSAGTALSAFLNTPVNTWSGGGAVMVFRDSATSTQINVTGDVGPVQAVPEPSAWILIGLGGMAATVLRRRVVRA